ncbi:hypothetical protein OGAPHI_006398 [Ogataea philodendri]|uniref:Uncharacterized protein n=1 Tax=Ogataea philodendri TaxID=1378263 RepID=A0A9P8T145_9ASCO|nr:uncharacterized protein OGAPHI_006398 [Ogataea philodendri]KAH3661550.1 hypothetical protein OGAPHI_006398 [Ogataea philodendri]
MEKVTGRLHLLREGNKIWRWSDVVSFMLPHYSGTATTSLDFINDQFSAILQGNVSETLEERGRSMVITSLGLYRLDDNTGYRAVPSLEDGNSAFGHLNDGISILWIGLDLVTEPDANSLPWKALANERTASSGLPGAWFSIQEASSSELNCLSKPLFLD